MISLSYGGNTKKLSNVKIFVSQHKAENHQTHKSDSLRVTICPFKTNDSRLIQASVE